MWVIKSSKIYFSICYERWSLEKTLMLEKIEGRKRRGWQKMRWLYSITNSMDMSLSKLQDWWWTGKPGVLQSMGSQRVGHDWVNELNQSDERCIREFFLFPPVSNVPSHQYLMSLLIYKIYIFYPVSLFYTWSNSSLSCIFMKVLIADTSSHIFFIMLLFTLSLWSSKQLVGPALKFHQKHCDYLSFFSLVSLP